MIMTFIKINIRQTVIDDLKEKIRTAKIVIGQFDENLADSNRSETLKKMDAEFRSDRIELIRQSEIIIRQLS